MFVADKPKPRVMKEATSKDDDVTRGELAAPLRKSSDFHPWR
jgi:hypothetical protein